MWYTSATVSAVQGENAANCIVQLFLHFQLKNHSKTMAEIPGKMPEIPGTIAEIPGDQLLRIL